MSRKSNSYLGNIIKIVLVISILTGVYFGFFVTKTPNVSTLAAQNTSVELPDKSIIRLNSLTSVTYDEKNWDNHRIVKLEGEAFFGVDEGNRFDVLTSMGTVSVLGTQFNVKQRGNFFEVTCYDGMVSVTHKDEEIYLRKGDVFEVRNGKVSHKKMLFMEPQWFTGRNLFIQTPLSKVLEEFEWQYGVEFSTENIDTSKLFTGNFTHSDLKNALKSITIGMNLKYEAKGNTITLYPK